MSKPFYAFFKDTVLWMRNTGDELSCEEADEILAWALHMHVERLRTVEVEIAHSAGTFGWVIDELYKHALPGPTRNSPHQTLDRMWQYYRKHPRFFRWRGRNLTSVRTAAKRYRDQLEQVRRQAAEERAPRNQPYYKAQTWESLGMLPSSALPRQDGSS